MGKKLVFEQFDGLDVFARNLERPVNKVFAGRTRSSQSTSDKAWYGTPDFETAMHLFNNGWTEKADEIRNHFVKFERAQEREVQYQKSRPTTSVVGFAPHVPNAILGLPDSMIYKEQSPMKAKVVRIIFNNTMNAGTSASDIMNAGLTVLKIAQSLERKGLRVRIDVAPKFSAGDRENVLLLVTVKDWRQPLDIKKVAFPIAHPSMFRRLGFCWMETVPTVTDTSFYHGYGRSFENPKEGKGILKEAGVLGDKDYFVNVTMAQKNGYDPTKTAEAMGIKL